jgi:hypothetical protein
VLEGSSAAVVLALLPLVWWVEPRLRPARRGWPRALLGHAVALLLFSALHLLLMFGLRKFLFGLAGLDYHMRPPMVEFVYELRKDALVYASFLALITLESYRARRSPATPPPMAPAEPADAAGAERLALRDGARLDWVEPTAIRWIEAAGNYVEIHAEGRSHLVRGTLAAFEERLTPRGFVRIHRSRLVNGARVRGIETKPSGDFTVLLDRDLSVAGSRRYRDQLVAALGPDAVDPKG